MALGWLSAFLFFLPARNWLFFISVKLPLNLLFNPLFLILLLKSWTLLSYKDKLDQLEGPQPAKQS